jgi:hypothetical protein
MRHQLIREILRKLINYQYETMKSQLDTYQEITERFTDEYGGN